MSRSSTDSSRGSASGPGRRLRLVAVALLIGAAYWYQEKYLGGATRFELPTVSGDPGPPLPVSPETPAENASASADPDSSGSESAAAAKKTARPAKANGYDRLDDCRWVDHRDNDGDSFHLRHGGREIELRLYYVDTPEKYLSDRYEDQRRRVAEQGRDFGGLSPEQTVEVGKAAKLYTAKLLEGQPFTVYTKWERVYDSERVYGFVELPDGGALIEKLVERGLGRLHTKGEATPEGLGYREYQARLQALERAAQDADRGAWGLN